MLLRILSLPASWDTKIAARATAPTNKEARQSKRAPSHLLLAITIMYAWLWTSWYLRRRVFITICFNNGVIFLVDCRNKSESINFVLLWFVIGPTNPRKTNRPSVVRVFPRSILLLLVVIFFFCSGWFVVIQLYFLFKIITSKKTLSRLHRVCTLKWDQCLLWPDNVTESFIKFTITVTCCLLSITVIRMRRRMALACISC